MIMKRAVIYARVSSSAESDRQNTQRQVTDLTSFASKNDIQVVKTFEEYISGAKKLEERAVLTECLEYCTSNKVDFLLVSELSRLGRSTLQVLRSLEILHNAQVSVYIQNIGLYSLMEDGLVNPVASILLTVLSEVAAIERSNIEYRLRSGLKYIVRPADVLDASQVRLSPRKRKRKNMLKSSNS